MSSFFLPLVPPSLLQPPLPLSLPVNMAVIPQSWRFLPLTQAELGPLFSNSSPFSFSQSLFIVPPHHHSPPASLRASFGPYSVTQVRGTKKRAPSAGAKANELRFVCFYSSYQSLPSLRRTSCLPPSSQSMWKERGMLKVRRGLQCEFCSISGAILGLGEPASPCMPSRRQRSTEPPA